MSSFYLQIIVSVLHWDQILAAFSKITTGIKLFKVSLIVIMEAISDLGLCTSDKQKVCSHVHDTLLIVESHVEK